MALQGAITMLLLILILPRRPPSSPVTVMCYMSIHIPLHIPEFNSYTESTNQAAMHSIWQFGPRRVPASHQYYYHAYPTEAGRVSDSLCSPWQGDDFGS